MMVLGHKVDSMGGALENTKWSMVERKQSFTPVNSQSFPLLALKKIQAHTGRLGTGLPRFGVLVVFFPPRILKNPFPKDERAFLEPKLLSSVVAEGPIGGFSLILLMSSLVV